MSQVVSFQDYARSKHEARPEWGFAWDGLVGLWVPRMGPTGVTLFDLAGYRNHGTLSNMDAATDWVVDEEGVALDFDGSNDFVRVPHSAEQISTNVTVGGMLRLAAGFSADGYLLAKLNGAIRGYGVWIDGTNRFIGIVGGDPGTGDYSTGALAVETWHHIAVTWEGVNAKFYIDGAFDSAGTTDLPGSETPDIYLGCRGNGGANTARHLLGMIGHGYVYNRVLTAGEIAAISQEPRGLLVRQPRIYFFPEVAAVAANIQAISGIDRDDIENLSSVPWADVEAVSSVSKD